MSLVADRLLDRIHSRRACVGVVGLGYVGLPLAVELARAGFLTTGIDVDPRKIDQRRLILLEEGHCLRDQALAYCATARHEMPLSLGATSLATVMQMVASGYGVTLVPQVAVDVEVRDHRVKLLRFTAPEPGRSVGLAWRRTSPRKADFFALGQLITRVLNTANPPRLGAARAG